MTRRKQYLREARVVYHGRKAPAIGAAVADAEGNFWRVVRLGWVAEPRMPGTEGGNYCAAEVREATGFVLAMCPVYAGRVVFPPAGWEAVPRWGHV